MNEERNGPPNRCGRSGSAKETTVDRYTILLAMILLMSIPLLARVWTLIERDDDALFGRG